MCDTCDTPCKHCGGPIDVDEKWDEETDDYYWYHWCSACGEPA